MRHALFALIAYPIASPRIGAQVNGPDQFLSVEVESGRATAGSLHVLPDHIVDMAIDREPES